MNSTFSNRSLRWGVQSFIAGEKTVFNSHDDLPKRDNYCYEGIGTLRRAPQEASFVTYPLLYPLLQVQVFDQENSVLLFKDDWAIALQGGLYLDLLPLLKGQLHLEEISKQLLKKGHEELAIRIALYRLFSKGLIVSGEHQLTKEQVAWWCSLGISPLLAKQLLDQFSLSIKVLPGVHLEPSVLHQMQSWGGWRLSDPEDKASLAIYLIAGCSQDEIAAINRTHLATGQRWCLVQITRDTNVFISPLFHPDEKNHPCWQCLHVRLKQGSSHIAYHWNTPPVHPYRVEEFLLGRLHTELSDYLVDEAQAPLNGYLISSAFPYTKATYHWVARRPQCHACGDPILTNPQRPPEPPHLHSRLLLSSTSGKTRHRCHQYIWREYQKFLGPFTGIASKVDTYIGDDWLFISQCDSNQATKQWHLRDLKAGFRRRSSGKGMTAEQSRVGALCESLERYSGSFQGEEEIIRLAKYRDFPSNEAISPNQVMLFSEQQYKNRKEINKRKINFYQVPLPYSLDCHDQLRWTPVWSLSEKRFKYMMTQQLYYDPMNSPKITELSYAYANSNGCAGGSCLEDAIVQGTYELIERDAFAIWWYNRLRFPAVDLNSFDLPYLQQAREFYHKTGRQLWVLDITHDFKIPCFIALSVREDPVLDPQIIFGSGAHTDPRIAVLRAITELNQSFVCFRPWSSDQSHIKHTFDQVSRDWFVQADPRHDSNYHYLLPNDQTPTGQATHGHPGFTDALEEITYLQNKVEQKGMEMLVLDQTRRDINFPVARVIIPGMRHFWSRLAPGRLYDIPVEMGWIEQKQHETQLNPIPMFF